MPELLPREGVTLFIAGHTPGWGELEFLCNGKVVEGVKQVDTHHGVAQVYARNVTGEWPVFTPAGLPLLYEVRGEWTARSVYPPDKDFDEPEYVERKKQSQRRCAARRKREGDPCCQ